MKLNAEFLNLYASNFVLDWGKNLGEIDPRHYPESQHYHFKIGTTRNESGTI
jgi:hypothetical protein